MFRKLKISIRIQFLIIAISLAVTSGILGLSAYLTDTDTYEATFHIAAGSDLGFSLTGEQYYDETIMPGTNVPLNVVATSENSYPLYVFVKIDIPADFVKKGFNSEEWHPIEEDSVIYYYGNDMSLTPLGGGNKISADILESITLNTDVQGGQDCTLTITGYAIQANAIPQNANPAYVFDMIKGEQNELCEKLYKHNGCY